MPWLTMALQILILIAIIGNIWMERVKYRDLVQRQQRLQREIDDLKYKRGYPG